jgi:hypothetical protein
MRDTVLGVAVIGVFGLAPLSSQVQDCTSTDLSARLQPADKVYGQAFELAEELQRGGIRVRCVLRSHKEGAFEGLVGAALYRTDGGDFEALFLSPPATFNQLIIDERKDASGWVYSFQGTPKPWPANRVEGRKMRFVKHAHRLLVLGDDEKLAATLQRIIAVHR